MSNYLENKMVDHILRGQSFSHTSPAAVYIALFTVAPSDAGGGTEVSGNNYSRVSVTRDLVNWAGTQGSGTTVVSSGTGGATSNNSIITFPVPSASWGTVTHFGIFDAATAGNLIFWGQLTTPQEITLNNNVSFAPGALAITFS